MFGKMRFKKKKKTTGQFLGQLIELYGVALRMGDQEIKVVMH